MMAATGCGGDGSGSTVDTTTNEVSTTDQTENDDTATSSDPVTYSISGTVTSAENVVTDSDVNDTSTTPVSNDSFVDAQEITTPVMISGYVNVAGAGVAGNSTASGDTDDYYQVSLTAGTVIFLYMVEDPSSSELNLYLYNSEETLVDSTYTDNSTGLASFSIGSDGEYFIRVEASGTSVQTATIYTLAIGKRTMASASIQYSLRLDDDFVPGEVLVRFESGDTETVSTFSSGSGDVSPMGFLTRGGASGRDRLLKRSEQLDSDAFFERLGIRDAVKKSLAPGNMDTETRDKMETLWMVRAVNKHAGVVFAEPNYIRRSFIEPGDTYYEYQWHYPLINLPDAWGITTGSGDVTVAVVDTGVLLDHPDLAGQLRDDGYDFISDISLSLDGDGIDDDPDDPGDQLDANGSSFHGTHVSGTVAALTDNTGGEGGVAGVAWNAKILPLRALGYGGSGTSYDIMQAVKYAAGLENDSGIILPDPADVINLSLGGTSASQSEQAVFSEVRDAGVIVVAAAGNNASSEGEYPAAYNGVISVNAVTIEEALASYSNYGDTIDVAAPGGSYNTDINLDGYIDGVLSTIGDDSSGDIEMGYAFYVGTSMAAPHVSGVIALMKGLYPDMTPDAFDTLLAAGYLTRDLGDSGWDEDFGWGLIDAYQAVLVAQEIAASGSIPALLSVSPRRQDFGANLTSAEVTVSDISGGTDLTVTDFYSDAVWMSISATADVDGNGLGTYTVTVDRSGLSDGIYSGTVTFEADGQTRNVPVTMRVGASILNTEAGYHYICLIDADTDETVDQVASAGDDGVYDFLFSGLSYGDTFYIYAGTDPDNDAYICGDGESCGAYLSLDYPMTLTITGDMDAIDFSTDINLTLPSAVTSEFAATRFPIQREDGGSISRLK